MYLPGEFPNFFLPLGRVFGVEIPVTRHRKHAGSLLATWQLKPMTPELRRELADRLADALVADFLAHPPSAPENTSQATTPQTSSAKQANPRRRPPPRRRA
jgi:hypothetical protein